MVPTEKPIEKQCIVCGAKSHRLDWNTAQYPACDSHSKAEVQQAIASRTQSTTVGGTGQATLGKGQASAIPKV